jgi:hypothetical protein
MTVIVVTRSAELFNLLSIKIQFKQRCAFSLADHSIDQERTPRHADANQCAAKSKAPCRDYSSVPPTHDRDGLTTR